MNVARTLGVIAATGLLLAVVSAANTKYAGGTGEPNDPYRIATVEDLVLMGETPGDYTGHFILTADIDLNPNLPGRKVFDRAVIAMHTGAEAWPFQGTPFNGTFDGNGHAISHLVIDGDSWLGLFGQLASKAEVRNLAVLDANIVGTGDYMGVLAESSRGKVLRCRTTGVISGGYVVGGLLGSNYNVVTQCCSASAVNGQGGSVGGLVGTNWATVSDSYGTGPTKGNSFVGGLVGYNGNNEYSSVTNSYSTGVVSGGNYVGGLVGRNVNGTIVDSFWDTQTSGQATGDVGTGKTTVEMQTAGTFLAAGWDFVGETDNGTEDIWWIDDGKDYPRFSWQAQAPEPNGDGFESGDFSALAWAHEGAPWHVTSARAFSGTYSARSGAIGDDEVSTLTYTRDGAAGQIGFAVRFSSEDKYDKLLFRIDGQETAAWSGEQEWTRVSYPVSEGSHTFAWSYEKDKSKSVGEDAAWIDDVTFPATP